MTTEMTRETDDRLRTRARRLVHTFLANDNGATAIEYALIASGIGGAIIVIADSVGDAVVGKFQIVRNALFPS